MVRTTTVFILGSLLPILLTLGACDDSPSAPVDSGSRDSAAPVDGSTPVDGAIPGDGAIPDSGSPPSAADVNAHFDEFFEHICPWYVRCERKIGSAAFGQVRCHPVVQAETRARFIALVTSGQALFDGAQSRACLDALAAAECNLFTVDLASCDAAFVGQAALGEACGHDLACGDGSCQFGDACPGTCVATAAGGACAGHSECEGDLACVDGQCAPRRMAGESCARPTDCVFPLLCGTGDTCQPPPTEREACINVGGFDSCGGDFSCIDSVCTTGPAPGDACSHATNPCRPGARCVDGTCVATGGPGAPCEGLTGNCITLHACVGGTCEPLPAASIDGGVCSSSEPCVEGVCVSGACTLRADGEECSGDPIFGECEGHCASGGAGPSTCQSLLAEGEECASSGECGENLECREGPGRPRCLSNSCG